MTDPRFLTRKSAAALVSKLYFPVSKRTLERWPIAARRVHGRALLERDEVIAHAEKLIAQATPIKQAGRT